MARDPRNTALVLASDYADAAVPRATRLAAAGDQNFLQKVNALFKGGKAGGATKVLSKAGLPLAGLSVLGSAMAAGEEFDGEGAGIDTSQAAGRFVGDLGTTATLAGLGTMIMPGVGTVALPVLGALLGINKGVGKAGAGLAGAAYEAVTGDTETRRKLRDSRAETQMIVERLQSLAPVQNTINEMNDARAVNMARQNSQILRDYNFANTLNASSLQLAQNEANALNIALQNIL